VSIGFGGAEDVPHSSDEEREKEAAKQNKKLKKAFDLAAEATQQQEYEEMRKKTKELEKSAGSPEKLQPKSPKAAKSPMYVFLTSAWTYLCICPSK